MRKLLYSRKAHFLLLLALLLGAVHFSTSEGFVRKKLQYMVFDWFYEMKPRPAPDQVIIVDIDDESLKRIGQWPWPRPVLADIVTGLKAAGAKVVAFDGVLAEPDRTSPANLAALLEDDEALKSELAALPDHDAMLAEAIAQAGNFVSAFTYGSYEEQSGQPALKAGFKAPGDIRADLLAHASRFKTVARFLPALERAAAGNGSFMARPEIDGIIRRTGLLFSDGENLYPALSLEALRVAHGAPVTYSIVRTPPAEQGVIDTDYRLCLLARDPETGKGQCAYSEPPLDGDGMLWIRFRSFDRERDYFPAYKVIDPAFAADRARLAGKIVLMASSAEGLKDLRSSPLDLFIPGVEIHANVVEQILQGDYLIRPPLAEYAEVTFILFIGLLMILLAPVVNALLMAGLCAALTAASFYGAWHAYAHMGILFDPVYPAATILLIFILSTLLAYARTEAERRQVRQAFGFYISPAFMEELAKNPDKLKLGGETRDLTVMFTDIRNFTTISERMSPAALIHLMNDFLTPMSDLVMQSRGTIDKFMGDAMMAFWNAPLDDPDHARHACRAALQMSAALSPLNQKLAEQARAEGKTPLVLQAGIGINTGPAAVGNMGSRQRFAYSALGDTVNLASRLESQTKTYGVEILAGPATRAAVPDFAFLQLDLLRVKGKQEPVAVYALLGDEAYAARIEFSDMKGRHDALMNDYRAGRFAAALEELAGVPPGPLDGFYAMFRERLATLRDNPPPAWDGVFTAISK